MTALYSTELAFCRVKCPQRERELERQANPGERATEEGNEAGERKEKRRGERGEEKRGRRSNRKRITSTTVEEQTKNDGEMDREDLTHG